MSKALFIRRVGTFCLDLSGKWKAGAVAVPMALIADPLLAQSCTFTTECFESDTCSATEFSLEIEENANGMQLVSDAETVDVRPVDPTAKTVLIGQTPSATHLLTATPDGARYSVQFPDGPMVVTYHGECSE